MKEKFQKFFKIFALVAAMAAGFAAQELHAQSYTVTNLNDSGPGSLRDALNQAAGGGTIAIGFSTEPGTIVLQSTLPVYVNNFSKITITAPPVTNSTYGVTLSANGFPAVNVGLGENSTVTFANIAFNVTGASTDGGCVTGGTSGPSADVNFSNCLFEGVTSGKGGGILVGGNVYYTLSGCVFNNCSASEGGAIYNNSSGYNSSGSMTLSDCTFTNCSAGSYGGAIYNPGSLSISGGSFAGNKATYGGAIFNDWQQSSSGTSATLTISDACQFTNNIAQVSGGAIYNEGYTGSVYNPNGIVPTQNSDLPPQGASISINNATFSGNSACTSRIAQEFGGGAIFSTNGELNFTNTTFSKNTAPYGSGGAIIINAGLVMLTGCSLDSNSCDTGSNGSGGGIFVYTNNSTIKATNCSFTNNSGGLGGAIGLQPQSTLVNCPLLCMSNCNISGNTATADNNVTNPIAGGVNWQCGASLLINSTFTNNTTGENPNGSAGGLLCGRFAQILSCTFTGNSAYVYGPMNQPAVFAAGGAAYCDGGGVSNPVVFACRVIDCLFINNSANGVTSWYSAGGMLIMPLPDPNSAADYGIDPGYVPYQIHLVGMVSQSLFQGNTSTGAIHCGAGGLAMFCSDYSFVSNCLIGGTQPNQGNTVSTNSTRTDVRWTVQAGGLSVGSTGLTSNFVVSNNVIAHNSVTNLASQYFSSGGAAAMWTDGTTFVNNTFAFNSNWVCNAESKENVGTTNAVALNILNGYTMLSGNTFYRNSLQFDIYSGETMPATICGIGYMDSAYTTPYVTLLGNYLGLNGSALTQGNTKNVEWMNGNCTSLGWNMVDNDAPGYSAAYWISTDFHTETDQIAGSAFTTPGSIPFPVLMPATGSYLTHSGVPPQYFPNTDTRNFLRPTDTFTTGACDPNATQRTIQNISITLNSGVGSISIQSSPVQLVNFNPSATTPPVQGSSGIFVSIGDNLISPQASNFTQSGNVWTAKGTFGPSTNLANYTLTFDTGAQTWSLSATNVPFYIETFTFNGTQNGQPITQTINGVSVALYINTQVYSDFYVTTRTGSTLSGAALAKESKTRRISEVASWSFSSRRDKQSGLTHTEAGQLREFTVLSGNGSFDNAEMSRDFVSLSGTFEPPMGVVNLEGFDPDDVVTVSISMGKSVP